MTKLYVDIETYCDLDLKAVGVYRYVQHPSFRILMAGWAIDDEPVVVETDPLAMHEIPGLWDEDVLKVAHNAAFERICFSRFAGMPVGEFLPASEWHDTQAIAAENGYPQKLEQLAKALGVEQKDTAGTRLINLFSKPYRGRRVMPSEKPKEWGDFKRYCGQDVVVLRQVHQKLGGWPTRMEREIYLSDQRINDHGIKVDLDLARAARAAAEENRIEQEAEFRRITGVNNPRSNPQIRAWVAQEGLEAVLPDMGEKTVTKALQGSLTDLQRRALELRQELALTASSKYATAIGSTCSDGRLRGGFRFHGAHTGRWAGRGVQLHNLPRAALENETQQDAAILDLLMGNGASAHTLKALVRPLFLGPFTVVDYSAIEARVVAWLAGEEWVLKAFRDGRDIYVETAERMGGLTRAQGKVAVLALGYNGAVGSLEAMGAKGSEQELLNLVVKWRKANPHIVRMWAEMDEAFREGGTVGEFLLVEKDGKDRAIKLPSGRRLVYHKVTTGSRMTFANPARNMFPVDTYGGRLTENVTQAVARDILGEALVRLHRKGFHVAGHVHDEILVDGEHSVKDVARVMCQSPLWAKGLPIGGEGFVCRRYRKG